MRLIDADAFTEYVFDKWIQNDISNGDWTTFREWMNLQETVVEFDGDINKVMVKGIEYFPQKTGKWIPCSERLPSAEHNLEGFLVTSKLPNYLEDDVDVFFEVYYNGQFGSHWDGEQLGHVDDGVIAWMECPSPYKENES